MRYVAAIWGILGVLLLLGHAVNRLFVVGIAAWDHPFRVHHWLALLAVLLFMGYSEGYRGFQKSFSPRVVARAFELARGASFLQGCLAPLYCMSLAWATRRRVIASWGLAAGIVLLVVLIRAVAQPWRGIVDLGVVLGLAWGMLSIVALAIRAIARGHVGSAPELTKPRATRARS